MKQSDLTYRSNTKKIIDCSYCSYDFYWEQDSAEVTVYRGSDKLVPLQVRARAGFVTFTPAEARKAVVEFCEVLK